MAVKFLSRLLSGPIPYTILAILLLSLAYLLTIATQDASRLSELFLLILGLGLFALLMLAGLLSKNLYRLYRDFKQHKPGARLTLRLASLFVILLLIATSIVYGFSVHFLHRGINSWFDVKVEAALADSLDLSRSAFGIRTRTLLRQTRLMAETIGEIPPAEVGSALRKLADLSGAIELSLWSVKGQLLFSSINTAELLPNRPNDAIFRQAERQEEYIGLDPKESGGLQLRAAVPLPISGGLSPAENRFLHVLFPINERLGKLGKSVQTAFTDYKELSYLRKPLTTIFILSLSLIVLLTLLSAIWFTIWAARRLVAPLQDLAEATQAVAAGRYDTQLTSSRQDEIGFLVRSFNEMTARLTESRTAAQQSHALLERERGYLGTVLRSLSSGVITLNNHQQIRTANRASNDILRYPGSLQGITLSQLAEQHPYLAPFCQAISAHLNSSSKTLPTAEWEEQITLSTEAGKQTLKCHAMPLPEEGGWVIAFDDVTALIQAQRNAAWGEVARRLAHEIKNPLTPIQLSAERLEKKYLPLLPADQTALLSKLTGTIIQQVDAMKEMVNDFSDYARTPKLNLTSTDLSELITAVLSLYQSNKAHQIVFQPPAQTLRAQLDSNRFRQVLHNLIKNAIEASEDAGLPVKIDIKIYPQDALWAEISITDHGPGIPEDMSEHLFEPYATSKIKGTGLGLAIVKKIIEEHRGNIRITPPKSTAATGTGTCIIIQLPLESPAS